MLRMASDARYPLTLPAEHSARVEHGLRQQRFFKDRFPRHSEFAEFLNANLQFRFDESSYYECSMSFCGGGPVSEGYSTDIDINAPPWFRLFERKAQVKQFWLGHELLALLQTIDPRTPAA